MNTSNFFQIMKPRLGQPVADATNPNLTSNSSQVSVNPVFDDNFEEYEALMSFQICDSPRPSNSAVKCSISSSDFAKNDDFDDVKRSSDFVKNDDFEDVKPQVSQINRLQVFPKSESPGCEIQEEDDADKVSSKFMSMWNNVKYGWSVKMKTNFSYEKEIWLLGVCYHKKMELNDSKMFLSEEQAQTIRMEKFKQDFMSRIWLTYRRKFPVLAGSRLTTDCGWGCMLRSGQMLLAQALLCHFLGRGWRWHDQQTERSDAIHRMIVRWFGDYPTPYSPFSLHCLVAVGESIGKKAGDWYGPASVTQILRHSLDMAAQENPALDGICIYVAKDCTVYKDDVIDLCTAPCKCSSLPTSPREKLHSSPTKHRSTTPHTEEVLPAYNSLVQGVEKLQNVPDSQPKVTSTNSDYAENDVFEVHEPNNLTDNTSQGNNVYFTEGSPPLKNLRFRRTSSCSSITTTCRTRHDEASPSSLPSGSLDDVSHTGCGKPEKWRGVVIFIPVRLGGEKMNSIYYSCIKHILTHENCIGIIGGRPRHSLYFLGWQDDKLIYLDPHYCQETVDIRAPDFPLESFHCSSPRKMSFNRMDPSCAIGFYCSSREEFLRFTESIKESVVPQEEKSEYPMFVIAEGHSKDASHELLPVTQQDKVLKIRHRIINSEGLVEAEVEGEDFVLI